MAGLKFDYLNSQQQQPSVSVVPAYEVGQYLADHFHQID